MKATPLVLLACFALSVVFMPATAPVVARALTAAPVPLYTRGSFLELAASHGAMVFAAVATASVIGVGAAAVASRPGREGFRRTARTLAGAGQSFPPAAVLALLVPALGFGARPTVAALALVSVLPIYENALVGFLSVPAPVREAAVGLGMARGAVLRSVELPLAWPMIANGLRLAAIVGLGTATIGSTAGALTLGTPVIAGLVANKIGYVLEGSVPLALLAAALALI